MKHFLLFAAFVLSFSPVLPGQMSHEEEAVRNAYAKVAFQCGIKPVADAAGKQHMHLQVEQAVIDSDVAKATPVFELSNFRVGTIQSIAAEKWSQFITLPSPGSLALASTSILQNFQDTDVNSSTPVTEASWHEVEMQWSRVPDGDNSQTLAFLAPLTVVEAIALGRPQWNNPDANYTRYAAVTVNATFQGHSTGPHEAIFLFGTDKGKDVVAQNDLISGAQALWDAFGTSFYPQGLLLSKLRDQPAISEWIQKNQIVDASCTAGTDLCCARGRCGLLQADVGRDLGKPLISSAESLAKR